MRNYYEILGIEHSASQDEIKSAYRKKVMEYHPDHYGEDYSNFCKVQEAYSILINPEERRLYDRSRLVMREFNAPAVRPVKTHSAEKIISTYDISSIFIELRHKLFQAFSRGTRGYDVEVILSRQEASNGGKVNLKIPVEEVCPDCRGYCFRGVHECGRCKGKGIVPYTYPFVLNVPRGVLHNEKTEVLLKKYNILLGITFQVLHK